MEDPRPPSVQPKKKLLFKRTIQRKHVETPKDDDDGLSLFSRSHEFFPTVIEDRQREAAEAEKARKEKLEREQKAKEESLRKQKSFHYNQEEEYRDGTPSAKKRRRISLLEDDESDNDAFATKSHRPRKSSPSTATPSSPSVKRSSLGRDSIARTPRSTRSSKVSRGYNPSSSAVITLDSSDDETKDVEPLNNNHHLSPLGHKPSPANGHESLEESDLELETGGDAKDSTEGDADFDCYIQGAFERAEKRKRERLEREAARLAGGSGGGSDAGIPGTKAGSNPAPPIAAASEPAIQILVSSAVPGIQPIVFKRRLHQPLGVVHSTWVEQQVAKRAPVPRAALQDMFFTWRGDKVYPSSTLETLGIRPEEASDGSGSGSGSVSVSLYKSEWGERDPPEGYHGRDKVHFEAWTQALYEDYLRRRERERRRARGELLSDDEEEEEDENGGGGEEGGNGGTGGARGSGEPEEPQKTVKVILKARGRSPENVKVRPSTTVAMLAMVFKRLQKLPADANVELHWDGEVLDPDSTVEDAEIEDMDSIEVHIK